MEVKITKEKDFYNALYLAIEITNYCNLNCKMCFKRGITEKPHKHMTFIEFKEILDKVSPRLGINFIGLGEPLLNPEFKEMLLECKRRGLGINFATNGMLLNKEWYELFVKLKIPKISISIDGATKKTYESIRINSNFEKVTQNIKDFAKFKKEMNSTVPSIRLDIVGMLSNIKEFRKIVTLGKELGVNEIISLHVQPLTEEIGKEHLHNMDIKEAQKHYDNAYKEAERTGIKTYLKPLTPKHTTCHTPWINPYVDVYKDVYACCLPGTEKCNVTEYYKDSNVYVNNENLCFGNLDEHSFNDIWNGKEFNEYRRECYDIFSEDGRKEWDLESYSKLRKDNPKPKNYCKVCGVRFGVFC